MGSHKSLQNDVSIFWGDFKALQRDGLMDFWRPDGRHMTLLIMPLSIRGIIISGVVFCTISPIRGLSGQRDGIRRAQGNSAISGPHTHQQGKSHRAGSTVKAFSLPECDIYTSEKSVMEFCLNSTEGNIFWTDSLIAMLQILHTIGLHQRWTNSGPGATCPQSLSKKGNF